MRPAVSYKPSNTFSFVGFILMFISMLITGALLSWLYVILQAVIPLIYLCILITVGFGAAIGGIGVIFVKIYKIRHPMMAVAATLIAMLFVYLFHWCVYVARDYDKNIYDYLKKQNATDYYLGLSNTEMEQYGFYDVNADELIKYFKTDRVKTLSFTTQEKNYFTSKQKSDYDKNVTIWEFYDYDKTIGTTDSEIKDSIKAMKGRTAYDYYINYRKQPVHNIGYLLVHPGDLWEDIRDINAVGRWTMGSARHSFSSSSSRTGNSSNVNGIFLWLTWIGEMLAMFLPAIFIVKSKASSPFIEKDNDWAVTDKPQLSFKFVDPFPGNTAGEKQFKATFMSDIDSLFTLQPLLPQMGEMNTYYTAKYCHSRDYTENYVTISHVKVTNARNNQRATSNIASDIRVDADYIASMHGMFGLAKPAACGGYNRFEQQAQQQNYDQAAYQQAQAQQQNYEQAAYQQAQPQQQNYDQAAYQQAQAQQQVNYDQPLYQPQTPAQQAQPQQNYGEMDGIDTSSVDLGSPDNMK